MPAFFATASHQSNRFSLGQRRKGQIPCVSIHKAPLSGPLSSNLSLEKNLKILASRCIEWVSLLKYDLSCVIYIYYERYQTNPSRVAPRGRLRSVNLMLTRNV